MPPIHLPPADPRHHTLPSSSSTPPLPVPPWWLRGSGSWAGHAQTIWTALYAKPCSGTHPTYRRERWLTPDQDFIDIDWLDTGTDNPNTANVVNTANSHRPLLVAFHGLEGSSQSHYALAMADWCAQNHWAYAVPHFRSCSGEINRAPRFYHMGDYSEIDWILQRMRKRHPGPVFAMGSSLGGNALVRWAQEAQTQAQQTVNAIASVCTPLDLVANAVNMDRGFCRWAYTGMFLRSMKKKIVIKHRQYPGLFDMQATLQAKSFAEFDATFTAPVHGFKSNLDYWIRSSVKSRLDQICIPALILNTRNDPFIPQDCLPHTLHNKYLTCWFPQNGGHLGFTNGRFPGHMQAFTQAIGTYFSAHL